MLLGSQHLGEWRGMLELQDGTRKNDKHLITHTNLHKPNNKLVSAQLKHFWCQAKPQATSDSQDSSRPRLGGSHHLPPYSIFFSSSRGPYPNGICPGTPIKFPKLGLPQNYGAPKSWESQLWGPITFCENLLLQ